MAAQVAVALLDPVTEPVLYLRAKFGHSIRLPAAALAALKLDGGAEWEYYDDSNLPHLCAASLPRTLPANHAALDVNAATFSWEYVPLLNAAIRGHESASSALIRAHVLGPLYDPVVSRLRRVSSAYGVLLVDLAWYANGYLHQDTQSALMNLERFLPGAVPDAESQIVHSTLDCVDAAGWAYKSRVLAPLLPAQAAARAQAQARGR